MKEKVILNYSNFDLTNIQTPVNIPEYEKLLNQSGYDREKSSKLIHGFKNGFELGYEGPRPVQRSAPNLKIRIGDDIELWNKIMKEVKLKRFAGPFKDPPFKNFIQSPIGLVPKDNGKDTRLIFHLSYPRNTKNGQVESVNGNTPDDKCRVMYPDFCEAILSCLLEGRDCKLGRYLRSAFRNLGICKRDWQLLCIKAKSPIDGQVYWFVDKCLPFGAKISCKLFQEFSNSLAHIIKWKLKLPSNKKITNYLDDFLFVAFLALVCNNQIQTFLDTCEQIRFPVSVEKTFWASSRMTFLGFLIDSYLQRVCIPVEKISKGLNMISFALDKKKITVLQLQKLCGFLNFLCRCVVPGRAFTRRMYSLFNSKLKPHHHIKLPADVKLDLQVWVKFLTHPNVYSRPFIDFSEVLVADVMDFYSDASKNPKLGFGAKYESHYLYAKWNENFIIEKDPSITYLELYAVTAAILAWGHKLANKRCIIFCDNIGACGIINHMSSTCKNCMVLVRLIVYHQMVHNCRFFARWVSTKLNGPSDLLSRLKVDKFLKTVNRKVDLEPTLIPNEIWPMNKIWID